MQTIGDEKGEDRQGEKKSNNLACVVAALALTLLSTTATARPCTCTMHAARHGGLPGMPPLLLPPCVRFSKREARSESIPESIQKFKCELELDPYLLFDLYL